MKIKSYDFKHVRLRAYDLDISENKFVYENNFRIHSILDDEIGYIAVDNIENNLIGFQYLLYQSKFDFSCLEEIYDVYLKPYFIEFDDIHLVFDIPDDIIFYLKLNDII